MNSIRNKIYLSMLEKVVWLQQKNWSLALQKIVMDKNEQMGKTHELEKVPISICLDPVTI